MAITVNNSGSFNSKVSVVENDNFIVTVSTAKEGFFTGLSTIISQGKISPIVPVAKIIYKPSADLQDRHMNHDLFVKMLDKAGNMLLKEALDLIFQSLDRACIRQVVRSG